MAQRALDPEIAVHLVDQIALDRVCLVLRDVALVVVGAVGELADRREPAAEVVIDLEGVGMHKHARGRGQRGLGDLGVGDELRGRERRHRPDQRARGQQALQPVEPADRYSCAPTSRPQPRRSGAA